MNIEILQNLCKTLPAITEDIKWEDHLCFLIGNKMFCVGSLSENFSASLKVSDEDFVSLTERNGIIPAPYMARYKWILISDPNALSVQEWEYYIQHSYELIKNKLPKKVLKELGL
ncbi:MmcQ/YjbR family DNA-binding protein [Solitalea sp. MAHUQ-68]|uniref:MmcQ/YjbR family DNA-binding protein n=1 Tax=Solitalea agri TaxID=2953739 RepID=A0A9X2F0P8_9SPHI|nr:MmcQ/YjbR family DNA-binding protein [Solitalea agri]MCO4291964.1 MmcQ/YjbR family DNA-binding protein [Solitalea agri]